MIYGNTAQSATGGRGGRGFTLVEMLVSVALAVILMVIVGTIFGQASRLFRLSRARIRAVNNARVAMDYMEADLEGVYDGTEALFRGMRTYDTPMSDSIESNDIDNDNDGDMNEDNEDDPYDFLDPSAASKYFPSDATDWYRWRSGMEFTTMSRYSYDAAGRQISRSHVLYYVTQDRQVGDYTVGRLIRYQGKVESDSNDVAYSYFDGDHPINSDDGAPISETDDPDLSDTSIYTDRHVLAYGVVRFRLRYLYEDSGEWKYKDTWSYIDGETSTDNPPDAVLIQMDVIDRQEQLAEEDAEPHRISRVVEVGLTTK